MLNFDTDKNAKNIIITQRVRATTLYLTSYSFTFKKLAADTFEVPEFVNLSIGRIIGGGTVVDDDPTIRTFAVATVPTFVETDSSGNKIYRGCYKGREKLIMDADLDPTFYFSVSMPAVGNAAPVLVPEANFKYFLAQFEID